MAGTQALPHLATPTAMASSLEMVSSLRSTAALRPRMRSCTCAPRHTPHTTPDEMQVDEGMLSQALRIDTACAEPSGSARPNETLCAHNPKAS